MALETKGIVRETLGFTSITKVDCLNRKLHILGVRQHPNPVPMLLLAC